MELYDKISQELARKLTLSYSSSFGTASRIYSASIRPHIFNIYGWVRIGDEIVDTYRGHNAKELLKQFKRDTYSAVKNGYSPNPIIHAFALTARDYDIGRNLIDPFITSMAMDLNPPAKYNKSLYTTYIYGSAEVVGLMCLKVFTGHDSAMYKQLAPGARSLGAAFQKINFLRDFADDTSRLGRCYFPNVQGKSLPETAKRDIIADIHHDLTHALPALDRLPRGARTAVLVATRYYYELLNRLEATPAEVITNHRIRVPDWRKAQILATTAAGRSLKRSFA